MEFGFLDERRGLWLLTLLTGLLAAAWLLAAILLPPVPDAPVFADANSFYCGGTIAGRGGDPYAPPLLRQCQFQLGGGGLTPFLHPPPALPLLEAWAQLPKLPAFLLLSFGQTLALYVILASLWPAFLRLRPEPLLRMAFPFLLVASDAVQTNLMYGQFNLIVLALALSAGHRYSQRQFLAAALLMMLAVLLKPYIAFAALAFLNRRFIMAGMTAGTALLLLPGWRYGMEIWRQFFNATQGAGLPSTTGYSQLFWVRDESIGVFGFVQRLGVPPEPAILTALLFIVLFAGANLWLLAFRYRTAPLNDRLALALPGCLLLPVMAWVTYLAWVMLTALSLDRRWRWLVVPVLLPWNALSNTFGTLAFLPVTGLLLLLWLLKVGQLERQMKTSKE